jgi:hypothetical protein
VYLNHAFTYCGWQILKELLEELNDPDMTNVSSEIERRKAAHEG